MTTDGFDGVRGVTGWFRANYCPNCGESLAISTTEERRLICARCHRPSPLEIPPETVLSWAIQTIPPGMNLEQHLKRLRGGK